MNSLTCTRTIFVAVLSLAAACASVTDPDDSDRLIGWSSTTGFVDSPPLRPLLAAEPSGADGRYWVIGDGISAPYAAEPTELGDTDAAGQAVSWPDVLVPDAIAPGTRVELHALDRDDTNRYTVGRVITAASVKLVEPPGEVSYSYQCSQSQCFAFCDQANGGGCNWNCVGCGMVFYPVVTNIAHVTSQTMVCNSGGGPCTGGNTHYCRTTTWTLDCVHF